MVEQTGWRRRGCLVAVAVVVVVLGGAALLIRSALDPENLRGVAEARLTTLLGQPVRIGRTSVSFLPTPSVEGREISIGSGSAAAPSLTLSAIRVVPRLSSIFSTPIVIERVELEGLTLNVRRDAAGRWLLPFATPVPSGPGAAPAAGDAGAGSAAPGDDGGTGRVDVRRILLRNGRLGVFDDARKTPAGSPEAAAITGVEATVTREGDTTKLHALTGRLGGTRIEGSGGASRRGLQLHLAFDSIRTADLPQVFALLGSTAPAGLSVEGEKPLEIDLTIGAAGDLAAAGNLAASRVGLDTLTLTGFTSPISLSTQVLTLDPVTFKAYGGSHRGRIAVNLAAEPVRWSLRSRIDGLDVGAALKANTSAGDTLGGTGGLDADVGGNASAPIDTLAGRAHAAVAHGVIRDFPLLSAINAALKISGGEGDDTRFESLSAGLTIGGRRATTDDLRLRAGELTVVGAGSIGFDQRLDFTGAAVFSRAKSQELIRSVRELSGLKNSEGEIVLPLTVRGTAADPAIQVDLARALEGAIEKELKRQLDRGLKRLFKFP